eukprot:3275292-Pyramimonas_sp.AAC.1
MRWQSYGNLWEEHENRIGSLRDAIAVLRHPIGAGYRKAIQSVRNAIAVKRNPTWGYRNPLIVIWVMGLRTKSHA